MSLSSIVRDSIGSFSWRGASDRRGKQSGRRGSQANASSSPWTADLEAGGGVQRVSWAGLPPELLREVVKRVEQDGSAWPARRHLVACAAVCWSWRRVCKEMVGAPEVSGQLTFPVSLKQPGPRSGPIQCYIKRNKSTSTYKLFVGLDSENGKFLLSARKIRRPTHAEYIISTSAEDISRSSVSYLGKLRSNFLGTKFAIYDSQPPYSGAVTSSGRSSRRFYSRKVSPKVPSGSYGIAHVAYELNMLGTRGPRRMCCTMHSIPASALEQPIRRSLDESFSGIVSPPCPPDNAAAGGARSSDSTSFAGSTRFADSSRLTGSAARFTEISVDVGGKEGPLILKNKPPRWHEQLQCWCLNFRGRVTVASVKNFQLIAASGEPPADYNTTAAATANNNNNNSATAAAGSSQAGRTDHDKIILQFGKIGKDVFTMDYRYPLSAFQAFGICLTSFDTKLACE